MNATSTSRHPRFRRAGRRSASSVTESLLVIYRRLEDQFGDLKWWPAGTPEEVVIGAILVQNVAWKNVERAMVRLREENLLSFEAIANHSAESLEPLIQSTLYYRVKARKLKAFVEHVQARHHGRLDRMFEQPLDSLREELLGIWGIGEETADDIILYAAQLPSFVVDTYTKRIFDRLGYVYPTIPYAELRTWFMKHLPPNTRLYNQFHALIDRLGHQLCSSRRPQCTLCPLRDLCEHALGAATHSE